MQFEEFADEDHIGFLRNLNTAVSTTLTTLTRVDEQRFRRQAFNKLPELLRIIADEEKRLPVALKQLGI